MLRSAGAPPWWAHTPSPCCLFTADLSEGTGHSGNQLCEDFPVFSLQRDSVDLGLSYQRQ